MFNLPIRSHLRLALGMSSVFLIFALLSRALFMGWFMPQSSGLSLSDWLGAMWMGARFDIRVALLGVAAIWLVASLPWLGKYVRPPVARGLWWGYWMLGNLVLALVIILDAGYYSYLAKRLSSTVFSLAQDSGEAAAMVWQSYPVLWISLGLLVWLYLAHRIFSVLWQWANRAEEGRKWPTRATETLVVLVCLLLIFGRFSQYPLRWSDTVRLPNVYAQQAALNPLHNLFDTWTFREQAINEAQMRTDAATIRAFVGLPPLAEGEPVSFLRTVPPRKNKNGKPPLNVVLVLLESFAGHKVGAVCSPMSVTRSFDKLAGEGVLFTRMMSAHAHTARGVFATVTGIPDVSIYSTASRNPAAADQHSIINEFKGYKKFYFIGGSTSWANVRGVLTSNIDDIEIYEQERLKSSVEDVWGVSDKNLFLEANEIFREQKQPFFAFIQTSGNHRPYTIPDEDKQSVAAEPPGEQELADQGFVSIEEYRGFAYLDWSVGQFMQQAKKEKYFENTVFAFIGDHGISGHTGPQCPKSWETLSITQGHTPFLIYAPKHLAPRRVESWAQQVDVMPTIASLVGIGYRNTTLGRDLLDPQFDRSRIAFEFQFTGTGESGVLVDNHMIVNRQPAAVYDIFSATPNQNLIAQQPVSAELQQLVQRWSNFPAAYGNAALYLQTHNPRFHD